MSSVAIAANDGSKITISGFKLIDYDHDVDVIKVRIFSSSKYAIISLNQDKLNGIDFNSQKYCDNPINKWKCIGKGDGENEMVFIGEKIKYSPIDMI